MDLSQLALPDLASLIAIGPQHEALLAALVSSAATLALVVGLGAAPRRRGRPAAGTPAVTASEFLIEGSSVRPQTAPARAMLGRLGGGAPLSALGAELAAEVPGIGRDLEALVLYGTGFRHFVDRDGQAVEIVGEPAGTAASLVIRPASAAALALNGAEAALGHAEAEAALLREVIDRAPVMAWTVAADGQIGWANAAYRDRFDPEGPGADHRITDGFGHGLEEVPLTARGPGSRKRVSIPGPRDGEAHWYELSLVPAARGGTIGFALEADDLVAAEASLRRFVETLTETFAHLPIGLAVFDKNRRLGLFNPALTELVRIDAVWLAGRPSLRDFLERLRETRQMPEQKDFASWRRKLGELEEGARDGTYEENWVLPSGKVFRVTGRPHPQGALAFLFEDISTAIMLERKYRSELELSQSTLDRLSEAVAVFDASGTLVFVNSAFEALWDLDPMARLEGPAVAEMTKLWAARCQPSPAWAQLAEFATAAEARTSWTAELELIDGRRRQLLVAPLPDASALVVFRAPAADTAEAGAPTGPRRDAGLDEIAFEQVTAAGEAAVRQVMAAIPTAPSPEAFQALSMAAQGLKDGIARGRELRGLSGERRGGPLPALAAALAARGLALDAPDEAATWRPELRRVALAIGLTAADLAPAGATVTLSCREAAGMAQIAAAGPAGGSGRESGIAVARRMAELAGGTLRLMPGPDGFRIEAELPVPGQQQPAEARRA